MFDIADIPKWKQYVKAFGNYRRCCINEPPRNGAADVIEELSDEGYDIYSVTAGKIAAEIMA